MNTRENVNIVKSSKNEEETEQKKEGRYSRPLCIFVE
jgi:hypothetical protein